MCVVKYKGLVAKTLVHASSHKCVVTMHILMYHFLLPDDLLLLLTAGHIYRLFLNEYNLYTLVGFDISNNDCV